MEITLSLPDVLAAKLKSKAQTRKRPAEEVAVELIDEALAVGTNETEFFSQALDETIARIKSLPPNPANQFNWEAKRKGLAEYLAASIAAKDPNEKFDEEEWQRNWGAVEAEMKAITRANDIAEGQL
ncbi:MAG: hypothetical protein KA368_16235 [Acidobacteria bacterium]|nr:hypothetical protein [Acidobacteriota bacterium]